MSSAEVTIALCKDPWLMTASTLFALLYMCPFPPIWRLFSEIISDFIFIINSDKYSHDTVSE